jgi:hypothetical protein
MVKGSNWCSLAQNTFRWIKRLEVICIQSVAADMDLKGRSGVECESVKSEGIENGGQYGAYKGRVE